MAADDRTFEKALARHLREEGASACPDAETLAAYHERSLSTEELTWWKSHIAGCADCQQVLAALEQTDAVQVQENVEEMVPVAAAPLAAVQAVKAIEAGSAAARQPKVAAFRTRFRWTAPAGAIAAGVLVWVVLHERQTKLVAPVAVEVAENRPAPGPAEPKTQPVLQPSAPQQELRAMEPAPKSANAPARIDMTTPRSRRQMSAADAEKHAEAEENTRSFRGEAASTPASPYAPVSTMEGARDEAALDRRSAAGAGVAANSLGLAKPAAAPPPPPPPPVSDTAAKKEKQLDAAAEAPPKPDAFAQTESSSGFLMAKVNSGRLIRSGQGNAEWRVGLAGFIEFSKDGGQSWTKQTSGVSEDLIAGSAPTAKVCWLIGRSGGVLLTTDAGEHWKTLASPLTGMAGGIHAMDALHAEIWDAANQHRYSTRDSGATWTKADKE